MNKVSRTITGGIIIALSVFSIVFFDVDPVGILMSIFFLIIGFLILFNKKEDEIEKIKKRK